MPLSWNDIRANATAFVREWRNVESEDADAKSFLDAFFAAFGMPRRRVASFEKRVKKVDGRDGYIDLLWKGTLLIEQKSRGKDLDRAFQQARDYFPGLNDAELPQYVLVSDFWRFRLYDLEADKRHEFTLAELPKKIHLFGFIAGYRKQKVREQDPVNVEAVGRMGDLHDLLKRDGYTGHKLELFLVRLLFRLDSTRPTTRELAATPALFGEIRQPKRRYLAVPEVSSENRALIPIGFLEAVVIATNKLYTIDGATPFHFGVLASSMHIGWTRSVCGRLKSDFQYSAGIVYNNFPWPSLTDEQRFADKKSAKLRAAIEAAAQGVLDTRAQFAGESLATLYNPETMPPALVKTHERLDRAVDAAYVPQGGKRTWNSDADRVAFLFELYQKYTSLLATGSPGHQRTRKV